MMKTILASLVLLMAASASPAATMEEVIASPDVQKLLAENSKEDIMRKLVMVDNAAQGLKAQLDIANTEIHKGNVTTERLVAKYDELMDERNKIMDERNEAVVRYNGAARSNAFAEAGAYQNGYDQGRNSCPRY